MTPTDRLIMDQQPYLKALARNVAKTLPQHVDYEELVAFGQIGLAEAAKSFDFTRNVSFTTFAHYRIRGAIFDGLRKMTWLPPAARRGVTENAAADEVSQTSGGMEGPGEKGRSPTAAEVGPILAKRFTDAVERLGAVFLLSNLREEDQSVDPEDRRSAPAGIEVKEVRKRLKTAIESLPEEHAALVRMLYVENQSMAEVGKKLGKNKSTVCRRHAEMIDALRTGMGLGDKGEEQNPRPPKPVKGVRGGGKRTEMA